MARPKPILSFIQRTSDRRIPDDYEGDVLVWDIDKTYLDTRFTHWRNLLAIPFEFAIDKRAIPGTVPLLRALRRGPGERSAIVPLYFVSGSPPELRAVIERKMMLDGVEHDGITFKDQIGLARALRFAAIRQQIGYKLTALLLYRREIRGSVRWLLFGDDTEDDATAFSLFGEVCAGLRDQALRIRLATLGVAEQDAADIVQLAEPLPREADPVERIFIHLECGTDPARLHGLKTIATRSFLQTALVLGTMGRIKSGAIRAVADDMRLRLVPEVEIERSLEDARARLGVPAEFLRLARRHEGSLSAR